MDVITGEEWASIIDALKYAADRADAEAEEIRRGYQQGTDDERNRHLENSAAWSELAMRLADRIATPSG